MTSAARDLAQTRLTNALMLFDEFVRATVKHPDAATLRGLEGRFAERLQIQPSYWSQIKSRARQIGERLARQFETLCAKPAGWMDAPHGRHDTPAVGARPSPEGAWRASSVTARSAASIATSAAAVDAPDAPATPLDDDERFIVGLVLSYYRRHPQRARQRLLDLLGEVLTPPIAERHVGVAPPASAVDEGDALWRRTRAAIKPLKTRR